MRVLGNAGRLETVELVVLLRSAAAACPGNLRPAARRSEDTDMDATTKPLRIPPNMAVYAEEHNVFLIIQVTQRTTTPSQTEPRAQHTPQGSPLMSAKDFTHTEL